MSELALRVDGLGKQYRRGVDGGRLLEWLQGDRRGELFWALRNVSFEVARGEMLGVIGVNGSGKSTMLRILSRLTRPTSGRVEIFGRVGSLLEVGTGFHPELTGRENVFLNGALLGMRRAEIRRRFDEIVQFAGLEEFIDTAIKRYSSGMQVRLGFAVSAHLDQEIMLLDEVLGAGDAGFRERSLRKMDEVISAGRTVVVVGHALPMIGATCDRVLWLDRGDVRGLGPAAEITHRYRQAVEQTRSVEGFIALTARTERGDRARIVLTYIRLLDGEGVPVAHLRTGASARIAIGYQVRGALGRDAVLASLSILNINHHRVAVSESRCAPGSFHDLPVAGEFHCVFDRLPLMPGRYGLGVSCQVGSEVEHRVANVGEFTVEPGAFYPTGALPPIGSGDALFDYAWSVERG